MDLRYHPALTEEDAYELERAAHCIGLPLRELELLGQDPNTARTFTDHVRRSAEDTFLAEVDWQRLERVLRTRSSIVAQRVPGAEPATAMLQMDAQA